MTDPKQLRRESWHPYFTALFDHSAAKPGIELTHPWGHSVFRVRGKTFVFLGDPDNPGLTVKPYPGSRDVLLSSGKTTVAHYIGRFGWVSLTVKTDEQLQLALDLIDESYEHNVPKARAAAAKMKSAKKAAAKRPAKKVAKKKAAAKKARPAAKRRPARRKAKVTR